LSRVKAISSYITFRNRLYLAGSRWCAFSRMILFCGSSSLTAFPTKDNKGMIASLSSVARCLQALSLQQVFCALHVSDNANNVNARSSCFEILMAMRLRMMCRAAKIKEQKNATTANRIFPGRGTAILSGREINQKRNQLLRKCSIISSRSSSASYFLYCR